MRFLDDWNKKDTKKQQQAGVQSASLPAAQTTALPVPLLTKSGVKIVTPSAQGVGSGVKGRTESSAPAGVSAPIVKPSAARSAGKQLVNSGAMVSDTGSNKPQTTPVTPQKSAAQQTVDKLPDIAAFGAGNYGADKRILGEDYNVGQGLAKAGEMGLTQVAKAGSAAGAWLENLLGDFAREGTNGYWDPDTSKWLFNRWNKAIDAEAEGVQRRYAENTAKGGKAAEVLEDMGAATVAAVPQAVAALLTGGTSTAATAEQLAARAAASQGLTGTISRAMQAMGKDPNFRLAFAQVAGPGYEQAKADGADDLRASLYAIGNGLMNAAVEAGGGIQTLPNELKGGTSAWRAWVDSMLDEGKEEVVQGVIERAMQNAMYGKDNPLVGVGKGAVLDPTAAAEEFAGGAVVGGLLGGGQIGVQQLLGRLGRGNGALSAAQRQGQAQEVTFDTRTQNAAESRAEGNAGANENGLVSLTEQEKINLSSGAKNKVVTTFQDAVQFVRNALKNKGSSDRAYMGKVPDSTARRVMQETGMDISGYNAILSSDNVRHIIKNHGDPIMETARGQITVSAEDIAAIPEVLAAPDSVYLSDKKDSRGRPVIVFEKQIGDNFVTMQAVSDGTHSIQTDTLFKQKKKSSQGTEYYNAGENADPAHNARSVPPQSSSVDPTVPQGAADVNAQDMQGAAEYARRGGQLLYAGENAKTADLAALERARKMTADGVPPAFIRQETGWYRGMDGKWRFEIDDSEMTYRRDGDARLLDELEYRRLEELTERWANGELSDAETAEMERLQGEYGDRVWSEKYLLRDFLKHDELFRAYPYLNRVSLVFDALPEGEQGYFDRRDNTIVLDDHLCGAPESTLVHEIQHVIQKVEGFTRGSSPAYWATRDVLTGEVTDGLQQEYQELLRSLDRDSVNRFTRYQEVNREMDRLQDAEDGTPEAEKYVRLDAESDRLYVELYGEPWFRRLLDLDRQIQNPGEVYNRYYYNTAGEIEARDAAQRRGLTAEDRLRTPPDLGGENTVFAEDSYFAMSADEQAGIREQLRNNLGRLNAMEVVGRVNTMDYAGLDTGRARAKLAAELGRRGYTVNRQGLGEIIFEEREINNSLNYKEKSPSAEDARRTGFLVLRDVLKRGIEIDGHERHKGRNYDTVTIAAPVEINGKRGNMAVVVKKTKGNRYKVHRILTPEGETFILPKMANAEMNTVGAFTNNSQSLGGSAPAISSASDVSIPTSGGNVNTENGGFVPLELPRLVDENGMDAVQRRAWLRALAQMPEARQAEFRQAQYAARRFGAMVQAEALPQGVQGSYRNGVITISTNAADPVGQVLVHELTHHMERGGLYGRFSDAALRYLSEDMGADVAALRQAVMDDYARAGVTLDEDGAARELVAKFAEEKLFTDEETVRRLLVQDRTLFQRIYDWLRDMASRHLSDEDAAWEELYGGRIINERTMPPTPEEAVSLQDTAEQDAYMEQLARDENIIGDDPYSVSDAVYDARLRQLEQQEPPVERTEEEITQADLDDLVRLYADQADPIGSREERIRDTEAMVTDHTAPERKSTGERAREAWSYLYRKMVDAGHSVSKVSQAVNDPYLYQFYNQARASASAGVSMIADAQTDVNARRVGESLNAIFNPIRQRGKDYYHDFQMYLFDLHNIDRMSLSRNKEAAVLEARAALRDFDADHPELRTDTEGQLRRLTEDPDPDIAEAAREKVKLLRAVDRADAIKDKPVFGVDVTAEVSRERARRAVQAHPEFEQYRQQVRAYIDNLMQYRVDSGLMTQENAEFLRRYYPNYVPTLRVTTGKAGAGRDRNTVRIGRTVGRAEGGTEQLVPLHEALGRQTMKVVREGSKNRFGQRLLDDYIRSGDNAAVRRYIEDAQEYDAPDFDPAALDDVANQPLAKEKTFTVFRDGKLWEMTVDDSLFDGLKALSPDAAESNAVTKTVRAANNLFKSLVTGYNPTFLVRNTVRDLQTAGLYTRDGKAFLRNYPKALAEIKNNGEYWQMYKALGGSYSSVFDYATGTVKEPKGRAARLMARVEALNMATEQAPRLAEFMSVLEKGGVNSETLADALYAAADVTVNFGRSGTLGKVLNANYVPFLNPGIQGFDKMIRRVTETKGGREWAKLIGRAAVLGIAPTLINSLLYHDDEEWDNLRDSDKDTNYLFKLKDGVWLKIPKGRELSLLGITADRVTDTVQGRDVDLIATINTMGSQVAPANPLTSNIASALVESRLLDPSSPGRTWYGGDIENQRLQSYAPGQRYDSSTDVFSKAVGGALGISPKKLNYVLDQYTGVVGDFLLPLLTPQAERGMFAKAFTVDAVTSNRVNGDFYDKADQLTYAKNGGDETSSVVSRFWSKQQSACSDLWKEIREVESSDLSDKEKRQKTRELKAIVTGIQKNALAVEERYRAAAEKYVRQGMETDDAYREANRECFGAEYAIQTYNKDVYQRAQSASANGVSYDDFYTYYFGTKDIRATDERSAATQKFEFLQSSGMSLTSQAEIYFADMASDKTLEQQAELESDAGITPEQFYRYKVASSGMTKKAEKLTAINGLDLTAAQKDALYYAEGWAQSTIGQAPWRSGYGGVYSGGGEDIYARRRKAAVAYSQGEMTIEEAAAYIRGGAADTSGGEDDIYTRRRKAAVAYSRGEMTLEEAAAYIRGGAADTSGGEDDIYARRRKAAVAYSRGEMTIEEAAAYIRGGAADTSGGEDDIYARRRKAAVAYSRGEMTIEEAAAYIRGLNG